jgi:carboxyl-terminal processing protease
LQVNGKSILAVSPANMPSKTDVPTAVLIGPDSFWSGEAIALAVRARANTRTFGESTSGSTAMWNNFKLSDGALLWLKIATMVDPNPDAAAPNGKPINPDQVVQINPTLYDNPEDPVLKAALEWLKSQPACK